MRHLFVFVIRMMYILDLCIKKKKPVLFVGNVGTGKSIIVKDYLRGIGDGYASISISLNSFTSSINLQRFIESSLERRLFLFLYKFKNTDDVLMNAVLICSERGEHTALQQIKN